MATVVLKNIKKVYSGNPHAVVRGVNLEVKDKEFVVLVGPSGCGKSTTLRMIAGLEEISEGEIRIGDQIVNDMPAKNRDIAMVFQNYALYPHMSIFDNLAFPLKMKNIDKKIINKSVNDISSMLGINHYLTKRPKELSGGERQRVALGRAIIRKPQLFLMDEPLSNLDAKLRTQMRSELLKLHKKLSSTVIYVTHDQIEALTMGNRIAVLNHGKIQQIGTPEEIYNNPINMFVGGFIGNPGMNFFDPKIMPIKGLNLQNKEILLGIRPEHLYINNEKDTTFNAVVDLIEMLGNEFLIYASTGVSTFSIKSTENKNLKQNDTIKIFIDLNKALFFDKQTEERLHLKHACNI